MCGNTHKKGYDMRKVELDTTTMSVLFTEYTGTWKGDDYNEIYVESYHIEDLPDNVVKTCTLHGLSQKLGDQTSAMGDKAGFTTSDRFNTMNDLFDQLKGGNWKKPSSGKSSKVNPNKAIADARAAGMAEDQIAILKQVLNVN